MKWLNKFFKGSPYPYGLSPEKPVCCGGGPEGEQEYIKKLRCPNMKKVNYTRRGSVHLIGGSKPADRYEIECQCGKHKITIWMDMYRKKKDRCVDVEDWSLNDSNK